MNLTIHLNPITKKNSQRILINRHTGRPFIMPSKQYKEYERQCGYEIDYHNDPIGYPVNVKCLFFMKTKRRVDLVNLLEAIDDILVKYNVLEDDNNKIIVSHDGSRVYHDKDNPRTEVYIEKIGE